MNIIAELSKDTLGEIYELTYKYGWIKRDEDMAGWLPDSAYSTKYKIEGELASILDEGLEELVATYEEWLAWHSRSGWKDNLLEAYDGDLQGMLKGLDRWAVAYEDKLYDIVTESLGGSGSMLNEEDPVYLAESYGPDFLQYYKTQLPENAQEAFDKEIEESSNADWEAATKIIDKYNLQEDLKSWLLNVQGWGGKDWLKDIYDVDNLVLAYESVILDNIDELLDFSYDQYIDYFKDPAITGGKSLRENIEDIDNTLEILRAEKDGTLDERIQVFQYGLTVAHHHGTMADHLLGEGPGSGKKFLDLLSSGPHVEKWDNELTKVLGHPPGSGPKHEEEYYDPDLWKYQQENLLRKNHSLKLAACIVSILHS